MLRRQRKWLSLGFVIVIALLVFASYKLNQREESNQNQVAVQSVLAPTEQQMSPDHVKALAEIRSTKQDREVILQKKYVCGEELQNLGILPVNKVNDLIAEHSDWTLALHPDGTVYVSQYISDLSPQCKKGAYFGLDDKGVFSLFEGLPADRKVMKTFFQLNIQYLRSSLPDDTIAQLYKGIRVKDVDEYNSVLSTFADYALAEYEPHMGASS
ncbi:BofC C-terminal domain-containing protein [Paenibacillus sp. N1-5-1-14]|nr:BofC C-terminal domain-containing protein [Paenibacillus radicibacter]